jgi:hypothetical protein
MRTIREHIPKYQTFDDVSPDTHDCHVGAEVELSIGDKVMSRKDKRGNMTALSRRQNTPTQFLILICMR